MTLRVYVFVWLSLLVLTAVTVIVAGFDLRKVAIIVALVIAAGKSTLVLLYFMHLRNEPSGLIRALIPIAIVTLTIFIGITYVDVLTR